MDYDFPYIRNVIIPSDFHIFQDGSEPPTRWFNTQEQLLDVVVDSSEIP